MHSTRSTIGAILSVRLRELVRQHSSTDACASVLNWQRCAPIRQSSYQLKSSYARMSTVAATTVQPSTSSYFDKIFPSLVNDVAQSKKLGDAPQVMQWLEKVLQYNCTGGKKNRGAATVAAYGMLAGDLDSDNLRRAAVMGWCVELMQAYLLILDDVMDGSELRRGQPCWYRHKNVGLGAVNDALMVQGTMHTLLRKYFHDQHYYADVLDTFNEVLFHTSMGQYLDWSTAHGDHVDLSTFTSERYNAIIKYKTAYYTFLLPVKLAMFMAGKRDPHQHRQVEEICLEIGHFFQIQDDYLDCFGTREEIGKDGTDIREGKCCWPAVAALQRCSAEQRGIMEAYYGSRDPAHERVIKELYRELGIREAYAALEEQSYEDLCAAIGRLSPDLPQQLFVQLLNKIYKRRS